MNSLMKVVNFVEEYLGYFIGVNGIMIAIGLLTQNKPLLVVCSLNLLCFVPALIRRMGS